MTTSAVAINSSKNSSSNNATTTSSSNTNNTSLFQNEPVERGDHNINGRGSSSSSSGSSWWSFLSLRELRHNSYWMSPISILLVLLLGLIGALSLLFQIPSFLLGLLMAPLLQRATWLVEFIYPTRWVGWCHISLLQWWMKRNLTSRSANDKNRGCHSRTIEQRVEVVPGRVYIHPIAQLLDNVAYLVVCLPPPNHPKMAQDLSQEVDLTEQQQQQQQKEKTDLGLITVLQQPSQNEDDEDQQDPIVAFVVDCADAQALLTQMEMIRELHYPTYSSIQIESILSTHKHHDHTGGNKELVTQYSIPTVYGGAVERIPYCNHPVVNGELIDLPCFGRNDMNDIVEVEVVAVPAHTRGSVTYALRPKVTSSYISEATANAAFLFTGDTIFSGGGGVPFEADIDTAPEHKRTTDRTGRSFIKAGAGTNAMERCFAEVLARGIPLQPPTILTTTTTSSHQHHKDHLSNNHSSNANNNNMLTMGDNVSNRIFIFPGHEYTAELLQRQFMQTVGDSCKWKLFAPSVFFETVSQLYVALHRRSLPHNSGKLLVIPSPLSREMKINPHYRLLKHRGDYVLRAIRLWYRHFQRSDHGQSYHHQQQPQQNGLYQDKKTNGPRGRDKTSKPKKSPSLPDRWNLGVEDLNQPVFTTLYTSELDQLIQELQTGSVDSNSAAKRLYQMKSVLDQPVVGRRPIPGSLPADKVIYKGILGLILLGSPPCAFTKSDSRAMKMPPPVDRDSDKIRISMRRLITVLGGLGLFHEDEENEFQCILPMVEALWQEAFELSQQQQQQQQTPRADRLKASGTTNYNATDLEDLAVQHDVVELGILKWLLYGITGMSPSWLGKYCLPCMSTKSPLDALAHPIQISNMKQKHGELVRHDVLTCPLCRSAAGCPDLSDVQDYLQEQQHPSATAERPSQSRAVAPPKRQAPAPPPPPPPPKQAQKPKSKRGLSLSKSGSEDKDIPPILLRYSSKEVEDDDGGESVELEAVPPSPFL